MAEPGAFKHIRIGEIDVWALLDATLDLPLSLFPAAAEAGADTSFGPGPFPIAVNCFAIRTGGRLHLVDTGCGHWRGPDSGKLLPAMEAAGLDPDEIASIVMTHLHGDHTGGLMNEAGPVFPGVELVLSEPEAAYWGDPGLIGRLPERSHATAKLAGDALRDYPTRLVRDGEILMPGVTATLLPGHTPGHMGLRIESGGESLLIWADIVHAAAIQFAHPDWAIGFDIDGPAAAATRARVFNACADDGTRVAGMHLPFPGIGRVARVGDEFRFEPGLL